MYKAGIDPAFQQKDR